MAIKKVTVTRKTGSLYEIAHSVKEGCEFAVDFEEKRWGVWMLGAIRYTEHGEVHNICPNSTDYELVLRCGGKSEIKWRGGAHADYGLKDKWNPEKSDNSNDRLISMRLYEAENGEQIDLALGESREVNGLSIVVENNIYENEYRDNNLLVNIRKEYLFSGSDIYCNSTLDILQDLNIVRSYSCMLPIYKKYGNCILIYKTDGSTSYSKTNYVGDGTNRFQDDIKATKATLFGEKHPHIQMTVEIKNPADQFIGCGESPGYMRIRDMLGGSQNKVYFTIFSSPGTLAKAERLYFCSRWSFAINENYDIKSFKPEHYI